MASESPRFVALVPAAGVGKRMGAGIPKQYIGIAGASVLERTAAALARVPAVLGILVVVSEDDPHVESQRLPDICRVARCGGATRAETVRNGLSLLLSKDSPIALHGEDYVLVHDAARPMVDPLDVSRLIDEVLRTGRGAILAMECVDTMREVGEGGTAGRTLDRTKIVRAATPQCFRAGELFGALSGDISSVTDEAAAMEAAGHPCGIVLCGPGNIKITRPGDEVSAAAALGAPGGDMETRVGQGWDIHRMVPGRRLVLGGVEIPHEKELLGHSDGDALLHAVTDAVLGAAGLGDIGDMFPPSDEKWRGADSADLLRTALERVRAAGWSVVNLDATVTTEAPKLFPWKRRIAGSVASILGVEDSCVNIKAKTREGLGAVGRGEALEASAAVLLSRRRGLF